VSAMSQQHAPRGAPRRPSASLVSLVLPLLQAPSAERMSPHARSFVDAVANGATAGAERLSPACVDHVTCGTHQDGRGVGRAIRRRRWRCWATVIVG
jgi:hypothetical protein